MNQEQIEAVCRRLGQMRNDAEVAAKVANRCCQPDNVEYFMGVAFGYGNALFEICELLKLTGPDIEKWSKEGEK